MDRNNVFERFEEDVRQHQMMIIRDEGSYRHLRFKRPGTSCYYFDLVTWPGYLSMTGDMGTWTFSRIEDMFEFFRNNAGRINPGYWSEKLEAGTGCPRDKIAYEWDERAYIKVLDQMLSEWVEYNKPCDGEESDDYEERHSDMMELIREMKCGSNNEHEAYLAYSNADDRDGFLSDFWEHNFKSYSVHFLWACHAILWGIQCYDRQKLAHKAVAKFLACRNPD